MGASLAPYWPTFLALALLIVASAFFSGSEAALISLSRLHARAMVDRGVKGSQAVVRLLEDRNRLLTSILIGNTIVLLATDSLATLLFLEMGISHAAFWSTTVTAVFVLLFGEIVPKTVAVANNERWSARIAPLLERISWLMAPIVWAFLGMTHLFVRFFGLPFSQLGPFVTEDDIRNIVDVGVEQKVLEEREREMIHSVIEFGDTIVRQVMTPRPDMVCLNAEASARRALDLVIAEGYSKIPIFEETVDDVVGVVHDRELLIALANGALASTPLRALMRPVAVVPETKRVAELLREMQRDKFSLAVVVDEYGGTAGIVTMEDLLEEIVGEIRDEHDEEEEEPIRFVGEHEAVVDAGTGIRDVNDSLGMDLPVDEFDTIGGLTVGLFGRLPQEGEEVEAEGGIRLRIDRMRGRRILAVRVIKRKPDDEVSNAGSA